MDDNNNEYNKGLEEGWSLARKVLSYNQYPIVKLFGRGDCAGIIQQISVYNAKKILDEYERNATIKLYDEVIAEAEADEPDALRFIVTRMHLDEGYCECICPDGACYDRVELKKVIRTGRTYPELGKMLKAIRGDE